MYHRLRYLCCVLLDGLFLAVIAASIALAENSGSSVPAENSSVSIEPGDLVQILVNGEEESVTRALSGQFRVRHDGSIDYPAFGSLAVGGKAATEVAHVIKDALGEQVRISGTPNVSVAEYAPVYLLGSVQRTGAFPYQPGMTVFQLVLLAGGLPQAAEARLPSDLSDIELLKFSHEVQRARLFAEIGGEEFNASSVPKDSLGYAPAMVSTEVALFAAHRRAKASLMSAYDAQRRMYDQEISSLEQSLDLHNEELDLVKEDLKKTQELSERGLVPRTRLSEVRRELVAVQLRGLEFQSSLYRAKQNRLDVEQKLAETQINAETQNLQSLRDIELQLTQTDRKLLAARSANSSSNTFGGVASYTLIRLVEGTSTTTVVDESATLQRGDILRVDLNASGTEGIFNPVATADSDAAGR
jgi:polysaccharide biosynthesis/export protein